MPSTRSPYASVLARRARGALRVRLRLPLAGLVGSHAVAVTVRERRKMIFPNALDSKWDPLFPQPDSRTTYGGALGFPLLPSPFRHLLSSSPPPSGMTAEGAGLYCASDLDCKVAAFTVAIGFPRDSSTRRKFAGWVLLSLTAGSCSDLLILILLICPDRRGFSGILLLLTTQAASVSRQGRNPRR
ncbi:uncharacterized protein LOC122017247 [Zingiber officinale]|uniref:uncharacterized protein LOC122017247 n=1 Tax=Zingiber officinale TaxID=94328 RepID=UPI001C4B170D|nr:uncharacterized protein LOC122017247 [Zingiber officinale]